MSNILDRVCEEAIEYWGEKAQLDLTQEECAELIVAVAHYLRNREGGLENVIEETADVYLMINQVMKMVGKDNVMAVVDYKLKRTDKKLKKLKEGK